MSNIAVILPAAGASRRFGDKNYKKPFAMLAGRAVWLHSAEKFLARKDVKQVIVVVAEEDQEEFKRKFGANLAILGIEVCTGGKERSDSIANALGKLSDEIDTVAVHDAARPCVTEKQLDAVFAAAEKSGAALLAAPIAGTLKRAKASTSGTETSVAETVDRSGLWEAQTPQVFRRELIEQAYSQRGDESATDDAQLVERLGEPVTLVKSAATNIKITTKGDLRLAEQILKIAPKTKTGGVNPFAGDDMWR
ncbi:2-C-methyl-D-erythritol 4-phosphate cytidylyltransferase [Adhaeretor mobilis]|uniref:2-C-methyl-D-erythritol 4-phosphate cytidylyltransferase n=1 Tax=Adhaeretor mobilis TaxID=1930276 RepID=A0A517MTL5_9BACT|nr:2-C-methyl-D-erythritol 4-phosphate cytidylyltransferase [Adhaeretor mobilis]QDS98127.1 2-C-methyl-D-erythritol 4-phosphate cytidylyltransferase [Adhaeretor mobilis]